MRLRIPLLAVILLTVAAAAVRVDAMEIHQTIPITEVYVGDSLNLWSSFSDDLAWWAPAHDPGADPPDRIVNITNRRTFTITPALPLGVWHMWNGENEKGTTYLFKIVAGSRPPVDITPTTAPTKGPTTGASQPLAVADYLIARYNPFTYECTGPCRIWLFGPEAVLGEEGNFSRPSMDLLPGDYILLAQYPDGAGTFEIFYQDGLLDSTWKDVAAVNVKGYPPALVLDRLTTLLGDPAHFHGKVEKKTLRLEEPHADITTLEVSSTGRPVITGLTNLPAGATLSVVFDDDKVALKERNTVTTTATGTDPGAPRKWQAIMAVDIQALSIGNHLVAVYPPGGTKSAVEFYVSGTFSPLPTPAQVIRYIDGDPFIPTPTPIVVEKVVEVPVERTVYVNMTPAYEEVLKAQTEAQGAAMDQLKGEILFAIGALLAIAGVAFIGYRGVRYLRGAMKRARELEYHGT